MRHHTIAVMFLSIAWFLPNAVTGQEPAHGKVSTSAPPHPVGSDPDLQGYWTRHVHPLECPAPRVLHGRGNGCAPAAIQKRRPVAYECHEGNHDLRHILKIYRNLDRQDTADQTR